MGDPGFISAFIGHGIQLAGEKIIHHINIAVRCRKELEALEDVLPRIVEMNQELQEYQNLLNSGEVSTSPHHDLPPAINSWLNKLNGLLKEASDLTHDCTVPSFFRFFSRYKISKKIVKITANLEKHLVEDVAPIAFLHQLHQANISRRTEQRIEFPSIPSAISNIYIGEALIVGQDSPSKRLEELIDSEQNNNLSRFGIVGKGGAGKTLLLKRVFNNNKVWSLFSSGLRLWLTISQNPSFTAMRSDLVRQISLQVDERLQSRDENDVKSWLNDCMVKYKFALFLDDVWETSASANFLFEELCVPRSPHHNPNIIVATSRSTSVLLQLGVATSSLIQMQDLSEDESWSLFSFHAFPHSRGVPPVSIDQEIARQVCKECGGLPLALKVIGHAMAGMVQSEEWDLALQRLKNDVGTLSDKLSRSLRLSYDALANVLSYGSSLQLCFLYLAAFSEYHVIGTRIFIKYWIGEGFMAGTNAFKYGEMYVNLLADRCLIEPVQKDYDGKVVIFRVHAVLHDLAHQIAEKEENCFFRAGGGLGEFPLADCSGRIRISLMDNRLTSVPKALRGPNIRSLLLLENLLLTKIPKEVMGSMTALRVLDLSVTAIQSLPESMGHMKNLVCLRLWSVPIKRLPKSISALKNLQILDLGGSHITKLPSGISKLTSLKHLNLDSCEHLQNLNGILHLTSLEFLNATGCSNIRWSNCRRNRLPIHKLGTLNKLQRLGLQNNGEIVGEGMFGSMKEMEYLYLYLKGMKTLPHDMIAMSKLRKIWLECPQLLNIENSFFEFQHLSFIRLFRCKMLEQLPALHKLGSLKHLQIVECSNIRSFPEEIGKAGGFPKLEVLSVVGMKKIEQLPIVEEGALPSLKILTIMKCEALQRLPQCYWNLESVEKIRVYDCSKVQLVMAEEKDFIEAKRKRKSKVDTISISTTETEVLEKRYKDIFLKYKDFYYGEYWCNEMLQFLDDIYLFRLF